MDWGTGRMGFFFEMHYAIAPLLSFRISSFGRKEILKQLAELRRFK